MYFKRELKPFISGVVVNDALPFPFLKNKEIYAVVQLSAKKGVSIGVIPANTSRSERIIHLSADGKRFILEEEVILRFANQLFKNYKVIDRALVRVTRSADIMVSGRGPEFRRRMEELVDKRQRLAPVRLEISDVFSRDALDYLCKKLKLKNVRVFTSRIPLDLSYLYTLQEYDEDPKLHYAQRSPRKPAVLSDTRPVMNCYSVWNNSSFFKFAGRTGLSVSFCPACYLEKHSEQLNMCESLHIAVLGACIEANYDIFVVDIHVNVLKLKYFRKLLRAAALIVALVDKHTCNGSLSAVDLSQLFCDSR